jgi:FkbM family methyltransferase
MTSTRNNSVLFLLMKFVRKLFRDTQLMRFSFPVYVYSRLMAKLTKGNENNDYIVNFRGREFAMEPGDITILPSVISGDFESVELDLFEKWTSESITSGLPFIVFDIGANVGIYSVIASQNLSSDSVLICVEPDERNISRLRQNLISNTPKCKVEILPIALSGTSGFRDLSVSKYGGTNQFDLLGAASENIVRVEVDTFTNIFNRYFNETFKDVLIKIDVEGFEPEVFNSSMNTIREHIPKIMMEVSRLRQSLEFGGLDLMMDHLFEIYGKGELITSEARTVVTRNSFDEALEAVPLATILFEIDSK